MESRRRAVTPITKTAIAREAEREPATRSDAPRAHGARRYRDSFALAPRVSGGDACPLGCMIDLERRWRAVITITKITIVREPMLQRRLGASAELRWIGLEDEAARRDAQLVCSGGNVLTADSVGSGGETRHQLHNELGAGKLDSVYFQSIPTDEAKRAGYFLRRLDAALATLE